MITALLIIDIQNDYFPGGKMELVEPLAAARKAHALLQCFRESGQHHVHIQHIATSPGATFFLPGDRGTDIHDAAAHFEGEPIVQKHFPNAFRETGLLDLLRGWGIERVVICGMMTHMCVDATARAEWPPVIPVHLGFQIMVAADACATRDLIFDGETVPAEHVHKAFLAALKSYGQVLPSEEILSRLAAQRTVNQ